MHPSPEPGPEPGFYFRVVRRGWRTIAAAALLGILAGLAVAVTAPPTYAATAAVLVTTTGADETTAVGERTIGGDVNLDTEARLLKSADVLAAVVSRLDSSADPATLASRVSVEVPANTTVLEITFTAGTPEQAREGARAFAESYLENRRDQAQESLDRLSSSYQRQLDAAQRQQEDLQRTLRTTPAGSSAQLLQTRLQAVGARIVTLAETVVSLDSTVVTPGRMINEPRLPGHATSPKRRLLVGSGAALGLLVGLGLAGHRERVRPRLRTDDDVLRELGVPVLVRLPETPRGAPSIVAPPGSDLAVSFGQLGHRTADRASRGDRLVVVPVSSTAAALHTGTNLAWQHARRGTSARLVIAEGHPPPGVESRPVTGRPGMTVGLLPCGGAFETPAPISVVTLGGQPDNATQVPPAATSVTVVHPGERGRFVDFLTSPGDAAVVLVEQGHDRAPEARQLLELLERCGIEVAGVVLHPSYHGVRTWTAPTTAPDGDDDRAAAPLWSTRRAPEAGPQATLHRTDPLTRLAIRRLRSATRVRPVRRITVTGQREDRSCDSQEKTA